VLRVEILQIMAEAEGAEARGGHDRRRARSPERTTDSPGTRMREHAPQGSRARARGNRLAALAAAGPGLVETRGSLRRRAAYVHVHLATSVHAEGN
jgi:hypothetical protein